MSFSPTGSVVFGYLPFYFSSSVIWDHLIVLPLCGTFQMRTCKSLWQVPMITPRTCSSNKSAFHSGAAFMFISSWSTLDWIDCDVNYLTVMLKFPGSSPSGTSLHYWEQESGTRIFAILFLTARIRACKHLTTAGGHSPPFAPRRRPGSPVGYAAAERDGGWRHGRIRVPGRGRRFPRRLPAADTAVLYERRVPPSDPAGREGAGPAGRGGRTQ